MIIRMATEKDLERIVEVYNQSVPSMRSTGDMRPLSRKEQLPWFHSHKPDSNPLYVAETDGVIIGYNSLRRYRGSRAAFRYTLETSYYVDRIHNRKGIATSLMKQIFRDAPDLQIKTLLAFVLDNNTPSICLLEKFGFQRWGFLPGVADFNGQERNHTLYGKKLT